MLRAFVIAGDLVYISYFYFAPDMPLWGGVFWSAVFTLVNRGDDRPDRRRSHTEFRMSAEERQLFSLLGTLSPGEFRRLLRIGRLANRDRDDSARRRRIGRSITLYYILDGDIVIEKSGRDPAYHRAWHVFIGEVAFLLPRPASATVTVGRRGALHDLGPRGSLQAAAPRSRPGRRTFRGAQQRHGRQGGAVLVSPTPLPANFTAMTMMEGPRFHLMAHPMPGACVAGTWP